MTEKSYLWTTGGAGDGASTYTRADWSKISKILATCMGFEGVAPHWLLDLLGSVPGANTARINTGGAVVDGKPYDNDAAVDVTIPSAVGGGNTRIDRIVLRANWAAQTVRITRIAGTDAASPTAPVITQTSGTTYDIMLYQALVNTSGTVTLTDERVFAANLISRQGGNINNWIVPGSTNYHSVPYLMQAGAVQLTGGAYPPHVLVTFPASFGGTPLVFCQVAKAVTGDPGANLGTPQLPVIEYDAITTTDFYIMPKSDWGTIVIQWFAVGPR